MATFNNLLEAQLYFKDDKFATENGMVIDNIENNSAVCSVILKDSHKNANGGVMGGVIFTLADFCFAVASNNIHRPTVGMQANINFLGNTNANKLIATAVLIKDGRTTSVYNVSIKDDFGKDIALFTGTGFKIIK